MNEQTYTRKVFRDITTGRLFCTDIDESALYVSEDNGFNWDKVADKGEFSWLVDAKGAVHVAYPEQKHEYPTSFMSR